MRFFDREEKIEKLRTIRRKSASEAQFTVITGRRRIGKTELVKHAYGEDDFAYLFVSRKSETDLVAGFIEEMNRICPDSVSPEIRSLEGFFKEMFKLARNRPITVFIDEFQEFIKVNPSVFSGIQKLWDLYKDTAKINLVVSGSVYTLMQKIFKTKRAALYGRETAFLRIDPFRVSVLKDILGEYSPGFANEDLLALWAFTGGVAIYVELLVEMFITRF